LLFWYCFKIDQSGKAATVNAKDTGTFSAGLTAYLNNCTYRLCVNILSLFKKIFTGAIARSTVSTTSVLMLRLLVQAGTLLILARLLGAVGFGLYSAVAALAVVLGTLATFGTHLVLLGEVSKDRTRRHAILPYALPTTVFTGGVLFVLYLLIAFWVMPETGIGVPVILALGITELMLQPLIMLASVERQAYGHIARSQLLLILPLALRLLVALMVWATQPAEPLTVFALGYLLATGTSLVVVVRRLPEPWPKLGGWRWATKAELRQSAGYAALNITALGPGELDKTLAVKLMPLGAVGVYAVGTRIVGAVVLPVMAMLIAALPRLFRESAVTHGKSPRLIRWLFIISLGYGIVAGIFLWLAAPIFAWAFGTSYQTLALVLPWLALAVVGLTLRIAAGTVLVTQTRPWARAGFELFGLLALALAALLLAPSLPNAGMPLALAAAEWSMAISGWVLVWKPQKEKQSIKFSSK
jgi:O-antigen/teichoic acid export membrane protein